MLISHVPSGVWTALRNQLIQIIDAGHLHVPHVAKKVGLVPRVRSSSSAQSDLFMIEMDQILKEPSIRGPIRLHAEEVVAKRAAPYTS